MGYLDEVVITVTSGDGGKGCISFRRERFIPKGGPDGGNGGSGGDIILKATNKINSLSFYGPKKFFKAQNGAPGMGQNRTGKNGADTVLEVPLGTIVKDLETGTILGDLTDNGQRLVLASGGRGGKGNRHFVSSTNKTPRFAQPGMPGHRKHIGLSLKSLADIGLVGLPNAGKSTLLSKLSMARPKIAGYPFTTLTPNLGVMSRENGPTLIVADIPGLISGASTGAGLGYRFLKHIERTDLLIHVLDVAHHTHEDILEDYRAIREEMEAFNPELAEKPHIILINKIDISGPSYRDQAQRIKEVGGPDTPVLAVSAKTGEGLDKLKEHIFRSCPAKSEYGTGRESKQLTGGPQELNRNGN